MKRLNNVNRNRTKKNYQSRKVAAEPLNRSLPIAIDNSFKYESFPSNAKVACVQLPDKNTEEKHWNTVFHILDYSVF